MAETLPSVAIVIPAFGRPRQLQDCLRAIAGIDYPPELLTVEIVDDGSPEPLAPAAEAKAGPFQVRVTRQANQGPAAARNAGAARAGAELLAFTDDDCAPDADWIRALARQYRHSPAALIGGRVRNGLPRSLYSAASQTLVDFLYDYYGAASGEAPFFTSNNLACSRDLFLEIGGFDTSFPLAAAEDREFGMRWRRVGRPLRYAEDALVWHFHALGLRRYWRQHSNYGRGARHLRQVLQQADHPHPPVESLDFYLRLISYPLRQGAIKGLPQSGLMILSQLAMISGFVSARD